MDDKEQLGPPDPTRRDFLRTMGSTAAAAVIAGCAPVRPDRSPAQSGSTAAIADGPNIQKQHHERRRRPSNRPALA